jgi:sialate O-acetylesterase
MKVSKIGLVCVLLVSGAFLLESCKKGPATEIQVPPLFSDNMILQQNMIAPVWGTANPGGLVTVKLVDQKVSSAADREGNWRVDLAPIAAGGPYTLKIIGEDSISIKNVMVGEVWICSGQSNMEWPLSSTNNAEQEMLEAGYPDIRLLTVTKSALPMPSDNIPSDGWRVCSSQTVPGFSAVAYFFGRSLYKNLNVPIGLIHTSWGGTPAEAWTSRATLKTLPDYVEVVNNIERNVDSLKSVYQDYTNWQQKWAQKMDQWIEQVIMQDKGNQENWAAADYDHSSWETMRVPGLWEQKGLPGFDGIVWFKKEVVLDKTWLGQQLILHMGPIDDFDVTWFNGVKLGSETLYNKEREYTIPASAVKEGSNVITVSVMDHGGGGGLYGNANLYYLKAGKKTQDLSGDWSYQVSTDMEKIPGDLRRPTSPAYRPSFLYNAMIYPLIPYAIQGAIWYQGESNADRAYQYRSLFSAMIEDWRKNWQQGDFPFLFVQLANYMAIKPAPAEDAWAELREAQTMALSLPNTGMAVIIDIGEANNIHPRNKQDVGYRLALNARNLVYGQDVPYSGPLYHSMKIEQDKIRIYFDHVYDGLAIKDGKKLQGFAIAGEGKQFVWADAVIDGESVVVSSAKVKQPVAVRYAWASNPVCNLFNSAGLPASPFRTDNWPGITVGNK